MVVKILITGASGLLGHVLAQQATAKGYDVSSLYDKHKPDSGRAIQVDITDEKLVNECVQRERPAVVINTASITDVDLCEREPELATRVNGTAAGFLGRHATRLAHSLFTCLRTTFSTEAEGTITRMIPLPQLTNTAHRSCSVNDWLWNMRILALLERALFSVGGGRSGQILVLGFTIN